MFTPPPLNHFLEAVTQTQLSAVAIHGYFGRAAVDEHRLCEPLIALLNRQHATADAEHVLLVLFEDQPCEPPVWLSAQAAEARMLAAGLWQFGLHNGVVVNLLMTGQRRSMLQAQLQATVARLPTLRAIFLMGDDNAECCGLPYLDWLWDEASTLYSIPLAILCNLRYRDWHALMDQTQARQCLRLVQNEDGPPTWEVLLHPHLAHDQLSVEQSERLRYVCLLVNQIERLILEKWAAMEMRLQSELDSGHCWFVDYEIECPIHFILREDDPRWRDDDDNCLHGWRHGDTFLASVDEFQAGITQQDYRDWFIALPPVLENIFIGRLFYSLSNHTSLSWIDIASIGDVWFDLTALHQFWRK